MSRRLLHLLPGLVALAMALTASAAWSQPLEWHRLAEPETFAATAEPELAPWPCVHTGPAASREERATLSAILHQLDAAARDPDRIAAGWRRWLRLRTAAAGQPCFGNQLVADVIDRSLVVGLTARAVALGARAPQELAEPLAELRSRPLNLDRLADLFAAELGAGFRDPRREPGFASLSAEERARKVVESGLGAFDAPAVPRHEEALGAYAWVEKPNLALWFWSTLKTDGLVQLALPVAIALQARPQGNIAPDGIGSTFSPFSAGAVDAGRSLLDLARRRSLTNLLLFDLSPAGQTRYGLERATLTWKLAVPAVHPGEPIPLRLDVEEPGDGFLVALPSTFVGPTEEEKEPSVLARVTNPMGISIPAFERTPVGLGKAAVSSVFAQVRARTTSLWVFLAVDKDRAQLLLQPGEYRIDLEYYPLVVKHEGKRTLDRSLSRSSGLLSLRVEPVTEADRICLREIGRPESSWVLTDARGLHFLEVEGGELAAIEKGLAALRVACAGSVYAPYLDLAKGRLTLRRRELLLPVASDPALGAALRELGNRENFPLASMAREVADRLLPAQPNPVRQRP